MYVFCMCFELTRIKNFFLFELVINQNNPMLASIATHLLKEKLSAVTIFVRWVIM